MKSYVFIFLGLLMFFGSCKKDSLTDVNSIQKESTTETRSKNGREALDRVQTVSSWLKFEDQAHYNQVYAFLETVREDPANDNETRILVDDKGDGYGATYDPNPLIADIEDFLGIETLRKDILLQEDGILRDGGTPKSLNQIRENDITSTTAKTLHSKDFVIQIGKNILKQVSSSLTIIVNNENVGLMEDIISKGTDEIYNAENIDDVDLYVKEIEDGPRSEFPCTAAFAALPGGSLDPTNNTAGKSFLWNNGDATGAKNLSLVWDFGDGTTTTTSGPLAFHKYENLQPHPAENTFNVCVTATYVIEKPGDKAGEIIEESCSKASCQEISISLPEVEEEPENDCDLLTYALTAAGLFSDDLIVNFNPTPGNATQACAATDNLLNALIAYSLVDDVDLSWTFQDQSSTSFSPCFEVGCDGKFQYTLRFILHKGTDEEEVCASFTGNYQHEVDANCQGNKDIPKGWENQDYMDNGNALYVRWRAKHETNEDDCPIFSSAPNQVEAHMKHYIFNVAQQKYKKVKLGSTIHFDGNIYPKGNACDCGGEAYAMNSSPTTNGVHHYEFEKNHKDYPDDDGFFCMVNDPYTVTFQPDWLGTPLYQHVVGFPNDL